MRYNYKTNGIPLEFRKRLPQGEFETSASNRSYKIIGPKKINTERAWLVECETDDAGEFVSFTYRTYLDRKTHQLVTVKPDFHMISGKNIPWYEGIDNVANKKMV